MLEQGARQEQQITSQGHKTDKTRTQDQPDRETGRQGDRNTYSATSTGSDRRGENANEPAKTIGQGAQ